MEKINFEGLPSTKTPINAANLNAMQDNIDEGKIDKTLPYYDGKDLNDLKTTGFAYASGTTLNTPYQNRSWFVTTLVRGNYICQTAQMSLADINGVEAYERRYFNGAWTGWIITEGALDVSSLLSLTGASLSENTASKIYRHGKTIIMQLFLKLDSSVDTELNVSIGTLDASIRPKYFAMAPCLLGSNDRGGWNHEYLGQVSINPSTGNIQIRDTSTNSKQYICINVAYVI